MDASDIYDKLSGVEGRSITDLKSIRNQALDNAYNKLVSEVQAHYTTLENVGGDVAHTSSAGLTLVGAVKGFYESSKKALEKRKAKKNQNDEDEEEEAPEQEPLDDEEGVEVDQNFKPDEAEEGLADDEYDGEPATLDDLDLDDYGAKPPPELGEDGNVVEAEPAEFDPLDFDLQNPSVGGGNYSDIMGSNIGDKPLFSEDGFETADSLAGRNFDSESVLNEQLGIRDTAIEEDSDFNIFNEDDVNAVVQDIQEGTTESRLAQVNIARGARPFQNLDEEVDENLPEFRMGEEYGQQYSIRGGNVEMTQFKTPEPETDNLETDVEGLDQEITAPLQEGEQALADDVGLGDLAEEVGEGAEIGGEAVDLGLEGADIGASAIAGVASQSLDWIPVLGQIVGAVGLIGAVAGGIGEAVNAGTQFSKTLDQAQAELQLQKSRPLDVGGKYAVASLSSVDNFR